MVTQRDEDDYRGYFDGDVPDDDDSWAPDPSTLAAPQVSKMLRVLRNMYAELADYELLHRGELARLAATHERHAGPVVKRIKSLEASLRSYALRSYIDFGKTRTVTPNGAITASRPLVTELTIVDEDLAQWATVAPIVESRAKVPVGKLRPLLERLEAEDRVHRALMVDGELTILDTSQDLMRPLRPGETGVYVERPADDADPWLLIEGLTWSPPGYDGSGRTFTVSPA